MAVENGGDGGDNGGGGLTGKKIGIIGGVAAAVVVVVVVIAVVLMYLRVVPIPGPILALVSGAKPPEHSAQYYPDDTAVYGWLTLAPGGGQFDHMQDMFELLNEYRVFEDWWEELQADFEDETGIDFEDDVQPWIGPDASVGLIDYDDSSGIFEAVLTIGVRDHGAAEDFMDDWLDYLERSEGADFDDDSYEDFDIWVDEDDEMAFALSSDLLVFATTEDTLEEAIDNISGGSGGTLADDDDFQAARATLPSQRFASFYIHADRASDLAESTPGMLPFQESVFDLTPDWVAISAGWFERGLVMEVTMPTVSDVELVTGDLSDPGNLLPDDTLGFVAASFDPDLDRWRDELEQYDLTSVFPDTNLIYDFNYELSSIASYQLGLNSPPELSPGDDMSDMLDLMLWYAEELTGTDFEGEFIDYLAGEVVLAVGDFDFAAFEDNPEEEAVNVVALFSYQNDGEEDLRDTMEDLVDVVEDNAFIQSDEVDVGADEDAVVFEVPGTGYEPGYVMHDGYLTFGTTEDALENVVEQQNNGGNGLSSMPEYQRALSNLPGNRDLLAYFDLQTIMRGSSDAGWLPSGDASELLEDALGAIAVSGSLESDYTRASMALTLFPE